MKRIYLFGRTLRVFFLICCTFLIYAMFDIVKSDLNFLNLLLFVISICFVVVWLIYMYSLGVFVNYKNKTIKIVTGFLRDNNREISLLDIKSIDIELDSNIGITFIIEYNYNSTEKIEYKFYRISFVEKSQYKRIKKQLAQINQFQFTRTE